MNFIELFAGIGGFQAGLESTNQFYCAYSNEWDKYAASIYRRHYGEIDTRDIRDVPTDGIPDHDLLTGGFPCQAFSVAGKRGGFDDTRGTLFFDIARILRDKRPGHFLLENVKGLLSHESGQTFHTIVGVLTDLGDRVEWMVLNSKYFGVPQNRERVFIVGHLRGQCSGEVFPIRQPSEISDQRDSGIAATLQSPGHAAGNYRGMNMIEITESANQGQRIYSADGMAKTLAGEAGGQGAKTGLYAVDTKNPGKPRFTENVATLGANDYKEPKKVAMDTRIRRLTPVECERLQAFPDNWTAKGIMDGELVEISDTQRYKCLGNAVTTSVIAAIGQAMLKHERKT